MALHPHIKWNDGEGIVYSDFTKMDSYLWREILEAVSLIGGAQLGDVHNMSFSTGIDPFQDAGYERSNLDSDKVYAPHVINGIVESTSQFSGSTPVVSVFGFGGGVLVQAQTASTPGSIPAGTASATPTLFAMSTASYDIAAALSAASAPPSGDPRWDTFAVRLKYESADTESRDDKDSVTGALTTASTLKSAQRSIDFEFASGAAGTVFDMAPITSGYVPLLTKRRASTEASPYDASDFYYHAYPMRLGVEDVWGNQMWRNDAGYTSAAGIVGAAGFSLGGSPTFYALPSRMSSNCRLVGVGILVRSQGPDLGSNQLDLIRVDYESDGDDTDTVLFDVTVFDSNIGEGEGYCGFAVKDWSPSDGERLPIWGNGQHYGPLFDPSRQGLSGMTTSFVRQSRLALRIATSAADDMQIILARFIYLY